MDLYSLTILERGSKETMQPVMQLIKLTILKFKTNFD